MHKPETIDGAPSAATPTSVSSPWLENYDAGIPRTLNLKPKALGGYFDAAHERFPSRPCLRYAAIEFNYGQTASLIGKAASGLQAIGLKNGDRLALCMPNHPAFVIFYYAALKLGIVVVSLNPLYPATALSRQLSDTQVRVCLTVDVPPLLAKVSEAAGLGKVATVVVCRMDGVDLRDALSSTGKSEALAPQSGLQVPLSQLLSNAGEFEPASFDPEQALAALQSTGGTTGAPKCAMLTHANFSANIDQLLAWLPELSPGEESFLVPLPMFHITGTTTLMHLGMALGACLTLMPRFEIQSAVQLCKAHRITLIAGVPTIYTALLEEESAREINWSMVKLAISGGGPLPLEIKRRFEFAFGCTLHQGYGLSETSPVVTMTPVRGKVPSNSIGLPVANTHVVIRSLEDPTQAVADGERGELCVKGPQVMPGYWNRPEETKAAIMPDGFFRTGDIAVMHPGGYVEIVDRLKDMIIAGGYNIFPTTVEAAIYLHPSVAECVVVGVADNYRGETVKAYVQLRSGYELGADELKQFLSTRLSPMEMPKLLEFRAELPKTAVGKLSRLQLREEAAQAMASSLNRTVP